MVSGPTAEAGFSGAGEMDAFRCLRSTGDGFSGAGAIKQVCVMIETSPNTPVHPSGDGRRRTDSFVLETGETS